MTPQEIIETCVSRMKVQNKRSIVENKGNLNNNCVYYNKETKCKCAVGILFDDETAKALEDKYSNCFASQISSIVPEWFYIEENLELIENLQDIHDSKANEKSSEESIADRNGKFGKYFSEKCKDVAKKHNLIVTW